MPRTPAKKNSTAPAENGDSSDRIIFANEPTDPDADPAPGLKVVERTTSERYTEPLPANLQSAPAPGPDEPVQTDQPSALDQLLGELGSDSNAAVYVYRAQDPAGVKFREPYGASKDRMEGKIEVDDRHKTPETFDEEIQRTYGGGFYRCVLRGGPNSYILGKWSTLVRDTREPIGFAEFPPTGPMMPAMSAAGIYPATGPAAAPVAPARSPREEMRDLIGMMSDLQKLNGSAPAATAPPTASESVDAQVGFVEKLLSLSDRIRPQQATGSAVAEVIRELGVGEAIREAAKAIPTLAAMYSASKQAEAAAAAAKNKPAPAPRAAAAAAELPAAELPAAETAAPAEPEGPQNLPEAMTIFINQIQFDGQRGRQPGIAAQCAEDFALLFPEMRYLLINMLKANEGETDEQWAHRQVKDLGTRTGNDYLSFPPFVPYMVDLREALLSTFSDDDETDPNATAAAAVITE